MKKLYQIFPLLAAMALLMASCGSSGDRKGDQGSASAQALPDGLELPLPQIPASLNTPEERADYLAMHFWDAMDWRDNGKALDTVFVEQNFANFLSGLPYTTEKGLQEAVKSLLDKAKAAGAPQLDFLYAVAEKYLYQQDSPMRDERIFLPFVDWAIATGYHTERAHERHAEIMRNRPGTPATDFTFELRGGGKSSLAAMQGTPVLLMFYEPDCDNCRQAEQKLKASATFRETLASGQLQMLAIYVGEDRDLWTGHAAALPQDWTIGIDSDMIIDDNDLYHIGATPSFYLIDDLGTVILKDADLAEVAYRLQF